MDSNMLANELTALAERATDVAAHTARLAQTVSDAAVSANQAVPVPVDAVASAGGSEFIMLFTVFIMACFVGYYVVWGVTPALHSPLMSVSNAISGVIIVGALVAAGPEMMDSSKLLGVIAVALASINIFGGFVVSQRMLAMFKKKKKAGDKAK
jgi:NAD(P) transhydrogenase subunit alpha